jgi:hypothetical protein
MEAKRRTILAAEILILGVAAFGAAQFTNFSRSFNVGGTATVVVEVATGDVFVNASSGVQSVQVDVVGIDQRNLEDLFVDQNGNTVSIRFDPQGRVRRAPRFEVTLPSTSSLEIMTAGGDITINGTIRGRVKGRTSGGDITLADVEEGPIDVRTSGGDISAGTIGGEGTLETSGGDIRVASAAGKLEVKTSGGDIEVGDVTDELTATTAGGDIVLGNIGGSVVVRTAGGDIDVGSVDGSAELKTAGGDIELESARGRVEAKTAGGDIDLRQVEGSISAGTAGGDIVAQMLASGGEGSEMSTAGGDVTLQLSGSAAVTVQARIRISGNWERQSQEYGIYCDLVLFELIRDSAGKELRAEIQINGGGPVVRLETVNGDIHVTGLR